MIHIITNQEIYECTNLGQCVEVLINHANEPVKYAGDFEMVEKCEVFRNFVNLNLSHNGGDANG